MRLTALPELPFDGGVKPFYEQLDAKDFSLSELTLGRRQWISLTLLLVFQPVLLTPSREKFNFAWSASLSGEEVLQVQGLPVQIAKMALLKVPPYRKQPGPIITHAAWLMAHASLATPKCSEAEEINGKLAKAEKLREEAPLSAIVIAVQPRMFTIRSPKKCQLRSNYVNFMAHTLHFRLITSSTRLVVYTFNF